MTQENNKKEQATDIYNVLAAMPTDGEIMNAIHREKPIEPQNGFENAIMKKEYVAGFLTAVKWMQERYCR